MTLLGKPKWYFWARHFFFLGVSLALVSCQAAQAVPLQTDSPSPVTLPSLTYTPSATPSATATAFLPAPPASALPVTGLNIESQNCTYSPYYWANHSEMWLTENIIIGQLSYSKDQALSLLGTTEGGTTADTLRQFITAALNILNGANSAIIQQEIAQTSDWLNSHPLGIELSEVDRQYAQQLTAALAAFNYGEVGPGRCFDDPATPTPTPTNTPEPSPTPQPTNTPILPERNPVVVPPINPQPTSRPIQPTSPPPTDAPPPREIPPTREGPVPVDPPPNEPPPAEEPPPPREVAPIQSAPTVEEPFPIP